VSSAKKTKTVVKRNPAETRERILKAAIGEFAAKGLSGARIDTIARRAQANTRMIYHYFGGKEKLYIATLEHLLGQLRRDELKLDIDGVDPLQGIMQLFDFIHGHFASHHELISLLSSENINRARYLKRSAKVQEISSPVLKLVTELLQRGVEKGIFRADVDPLNLYVTMVSLSYFQISNAHTLSIIFQRDLLDPTWQAAYKLQVRDMLVSYLQQQPALTHSSGASVRSAAS
jgi:AcrR family transcriptional regulator